MSESFAAGGGRRRGAPEQWTHDTLSAPKQAQAEDEEALQSGGESPTAASPSVSAALGALILPVYLPRAILSTGAGLVIVARPLLARHLGCDDRQTGFIAAAVPLVRSCHGVVHTHAPHAPWRALTGLAVADPTGRALTAPAQQGRMLANMPAGLLSQGMGHTPGMAFGALLLALGALVTAAAAGASLR
jgi:hypothetical protein